VSPAAWTAGRAQDHLLSLELFGMRFGLDRMQALTAALGRPQDRFSSIHVVGTNGKSSTVRMTAAILAAHGVRTGAYLSPHLTSFVERIHIDGADLGAAAFGAAVQRAAAAAEQIDRTRAADDGVTQFECLTAAAYDELARAGVEVAVVEAGLGGRYDATNVLGSRIVVLTNVGLEHTRWLGTTVTDIACEKLAVLHDDATLVVAEGLHPDAMREARAAARRHSARIVHAEPAWTGELAARGAFQRRNFALARAAAAAHLGVLDEDRVRRVAATVQVPGRFEVIARDPLTIVDGAHNQPGIAAAVASLPAGVDTVGVVSILDDKDARGMLELLLGRCRALVLTSNPNPRAMAPAALEALARELGTPVSRLRVESDPRRALELARGLAGPRGAVLATGSIYLVAELLTQPGRPRAMSTL